MKITLRRKIGRDCFVNNRERMQNEIELNAKIILMVPEHRVIKDVAEIALKAENQLNEAAILYLDQGHTWVGFRIHIQSEGMRVNGKEIVNAADNH